MKRIHRIIAAAVVAAGVGLVALNAQPAFAATASSADFAALKALAPGAAIAGPGSVAPFALQGVVTASGRAVGAGVPVFLFAAPPQAESAALKIGQRVQFAMVAATLTDARGMYAFPQSAVMPRLASMRSEFQQVVVPSISQSGARVVNLLQPDPVIQNGAVVGGLMAAADGSSTASTVTAASLATHNGNVAMAGGVETASQLQASVRSRGLTASSSYCSGIVCYYETLQKTWNQPVLVGQTASTTSGAWAQFTYSVGASSSLGIGVSASGGAATYSQSATTSVKTTSTIAFAKRTGVHNIYYQSAYVYGKYSEETYVAWVRTSLTYLTRPTGTFAGGNYSVTSGTALRSQNPSQYCGPYKPGDSLKKTTTNATTWSNGVGINLSDIKANLSAQTGYSTSVSVTVGRTTSGYICGVYAAAASGSPGVIYASDTKS